MLEGKLKVGHVSWNQAFYLVTELGVTHSIAVICTTYIFERMIKIPIQSHVWFGKLKDYLHTSVLPKTRFKKQSLVAPPPPPLQCVCRGGEDLRLYFYCCSCLVEKMDISSLILFHFLNVLAGRWRPCVASKTIFLGVNKNRSNLN